MDGQCPLNDKFAEHSAHEASSAWQRPPIPGPTCQLTDLEEMAAGLAFCFCCFPYWVGLGYFVFVTGNVTAGLNLIEVFCMHTPRPPG